MKMKSLNSIVCVLQVKAIRSPCKEPPGNKQETKHSTETATCTKINSSLPYHAPQRRIPVKQPMALVDQPISINLIVILAGAHEH